MIVEETGPAKSGKTTRLIARANKERAAGKAVTFHSFELTVVTLHLKGLHPAIPVVMNGGDKYREYIEIEE